MQRLALEFGTGTGTKFASLEYSANKRLCRSLGVVDRLPMVLLYSPHGELIDHYPCNAKLARTTLRDQLTQYDPSSSLEELKFQVQMNRGTALGNEVVMTQLQQERRMRVEELLQPSSIIRPSKFGMNETSSVATLEPPSRNTGGSRRRFWPFSRSDRNP